MLMALGLGTAAVALIISLELAHTQRSRVSVIAAGSFGLVAVALTTFGRSRIRLLGTRMDEDATEEFNFTVALAAMFAVDVLAALFAGSSRPLVAWVLLGAAAAWVLLWLPPPLRRLTATTSMIFACDRATVFAFLSDFRNVPSYMPNVELVEKLTGGPIGIGTRFLTRVHIPNGVVEAVDRIIDFEQDTRYASSIELSRQHPIGVATFASAPEGTLAAFRFTTTRSYSSALLGSSLRRWPMAQRLSAQRRAAWTRVKELLESEEPATT
jgi:hypothetical protein